MTDPALPFDETGGAVVDAVVHHPRVILLGRTQAEQRRVDAFARDLAQWLHGTPRADLGALVRVITVVLQRELRTTRAVCRGRPLLAVEAAARATEVLWPLLRPPLAPEPPPPAPVPGSEPDYTDDTDDTDAPSAVAGGEGGEGGEAGPPAAAPRDPGDVLAALAELDAVDDPELRHFAELLRGRVEGDAVEVGSEAADMLEGVGFAATSGALETDRIARHLERFLPGIGWSTAPGQLELSLLDRLEGLTALLGQLDGLAELADRLGRLEEASRRAGPKVGGRENVVGVRFGGEVATALPSELGLLGDPATEDLFYHRYLERRLVSLELTGAGDEGSAAGDERGPVIACIDTSASMEGAPEMAAKALVLAVCRKVIPRGRTVHLILFGGPGESTEIRLRRGLGGLEGLVEFLQASFHSGTDFDGPLLRAMDLLEEQELHAADVLVVTDGLCRAGDEVVDRVEEVRRATGVRVWSVILGRRDLGGVEPFSDEVWQLDPTDAAGAVGLVRGLGGKR